MANPQLGRRSTTALAFLSRVPRFVLILVVLAALLGGLFTPGLLGAFLLVIVAAFAGWLAWMSWPGQPAFTRALRVLVVAGMLALAVDKLL